MATISARITQQLANGLKRFQPIIQGARARDINESDTVTIVTDVLGELFGFDKYAELTSEYAIRGTYCDLAIKCDNALKVLIEVKAIGTDFKTSHLKQAVDYAANQGVDWVILTNGMIWQVYRVTFAKPIDQELVCELNLLELNPRSQSDLETLFLLTRDGLQRSALDEHYARRQATNRFLLGALLVSDPVMSVVRRELRRISPDIRVECEEIRQIVLNEVLKRDVVESAEATEAAKRIRRAENARLRAARPGRAESPCDVELAEVIEAAEDAGDSETPAAEVGTSS